MKKKAKDTVIALALIFGLIFVTTINICPIPVFAQTNQTSNSIVTNGNTTRATASTSPMDTFYASGDISSLIFVTQKPINATINPSSLSDATKFVLSGDWNLTVNTGKVTNFAAKFIKVLNDSSK